MNPRIALCIATIAMCAACGGNGPGDTPMAATPDGAINMTPVTHPEPAVGSIEGHTGQAGGGQGQAARDAGVTPANGGNGGVPGFAGSGAGGTGTGGIPGFTGTGGTGFNNTNTNIPGFTGTGGTGFNNTNTNIPGFTGTGGTGFSSTDTMPPTAGETGTVGNALDAGASNTTTRGGITVSSRAASGDVAAVPPQAGGMNGNTNR
jgi:hypothetical protein